MSRRQSAPEVPWLAEEPLEPGGRIFVAHGELDVAIAPYLRRQLTGALENGAQRLLLDFTDVTFLDSLTLAAILAAQRRLPEGGRLAVAAAHPYVLLVVEASGISSLVELYGTRDEALAALAA